VFPLDERRSRAFFCSAVAKDDGPVSGRRCFMLQARRGEAGAGLAMPASARRASWMPRAARRTPREWPRRASRPWPSPDGVGREGACPFDSFAAVSRFSQYSSGKREAELLDRSRMRCGLGKGEIPPTSGADQLLEGHGDQDQRPPVAGR